MAKSLGNFHTLRDMLDRGYTGREVRYVLIGTNYRQTLNFTFAALDGARAALARLDEFRGRLTDLSVGEPAQAEHAVNIAYGRIMPAEVPALPTAPLTAPPRCNVVTGTHKQYQGKGMRLNRFICAATFGFLAATTTTVNADTWRFGLEEIEGSVQHLYAQQFREQVEALSGGRIEVDVFPYGSLGTSAQLTDLTRNGSVNLAFASPGHLADTVPETGLFNLHFLLPEEQEPARRLLEAPEFISAFEPAYHNAGLQLLGFVPEGWMTWTANQPLRSPDDFQGLRIRTMTSNMAAEAYRAYGAEPVQTPYSQVYSDLQLRKIDGQTNPVFAIEEMDFHEVQTTLTMARASYFVASIVSNQQWYNDLPDRERTWLNDAVRDLAGFAWESQETLNQQRLESMVEAGGIQVVLLDDEERERFRQASLPVRDKYLEQTGETGMALLKFVDEWTQP